MAALTNAKHESFCLVWHETGNKTEAYRRSHPNSSKWKDDTIHKRASELSLKGEISGRYKELQDLALKSHGITIESLLRELDEARGIALSADTPQSSAAITATMSKAKLVGLDRQIIETKTAVVDKSDLNW